MLSDVQAQAVTNDTNAAAHALCVQRVTPSCKTSAALATEREPGLTIYSSNTGTQSTVALLLQQRLAAEAATTAANVTQAAPAAGVSSQAGQTLLFGTAASHVWVTKDISIYTTCMRALRCHLCGLPSKKAHAFRTQQQTGLPCTLCLATYTCAMAAMKPTAAWFKSCYARRAGKHQDLPRWRVPDSAWSEPVIERMCVNAAADLAVHKWHAQACMHLNAAQHARTLLYINSSTGSQWHDNTGKHPQALPAWQPRLPHTHAPEIHSNNQHVPTLTCVTSC